MTQNPQLELAINFVQFTNKNLFLTGKAGTGKTTFLHNLKKSSLKRMAVVAPTGVAAINAGGVTIHSFFQLPFVPYVPGSNGAQQQRRFQRDKINLIKSLDLLVIDEISMVRADTLDNIDEVLRRLRNPAKPFGGVQLLMIGDLHQLSPVVKDEDWKILKEHYSSLYFFNSKALHKTSHVTIELKHIYRQSDSFFIDLLNRVRENRIDADVLASLNQRYIHNFKPADDEGYITLTTHNATAQEINENKLAEIKLKSQRFKATIEGEFPEFAYPTALDLEVKIGAQVMFIKNDPSREKLFYNGKIGNVTRIDNQVIYVKCSSDSMEIAVEPLEWNNISYELNAETKEVTENIIGRFIQHPLKLAWAITIHKSQGLTFEKAIIDANAAFAHGQVYVALSRCKSFEGLVLRSQLSNNSVKTDGTVATYTVHASNNAPDEAYLIKSKIDFQRSLIFELFDFSSIKSRFFQLRKITEDHYVSVSPQLAEELQIIREAADREIFEVSENFRKQLRTLLTAETLPEENPELQERIKKAAAYFIEKLNEGFALTLQKTNIESDNKTVKTSLKEALENILKDVFIATACLKTSQNNFSTISFLQTKVNAELDFASSIKTEQSAEARVSDKIPHGELFATIRKWRNNLAAENNVPVYLILSQKSLLEIVARLPLSIAQLESVKGMGKVKIKQYGAEILQMVSSYCKKNGIEGSIISIPVKEEKTKVDTKKISLDYFKEGKTVSEIAQLRGYTLGTIEGHLSSFIPSGEVSVFDIVSKLKVAKIMAHLVQNPGLNTAAYKASLGDDISYAELRAVLNHLNYVNSELVT